MTTRYLNLKSAPHGWPKQNSVLHDPDSRYWGDRAEAAAAECAERFGPKRWAQIYDEVFGDGGLPTWQETAETIERILEVTDPADCTCNGVNNPNGCDACREYAARKYGNSIPFRGE